MASTSRRASSSRRPAPPRCTWAARKGSDARPSPSERCGCAASAGSSATAATWLASRIRSCSWCHSGASEASGADRSSSFWRVDDLGERIRALPGADRLLPALEGLAPAWLVGGAVRDLMLGGTTVDLDVAIEGDAREVARELAVRTGGEAVEHERFGTATVKADGLAVD